MIREDAPLREVREWLQENVGDGVTCPCCGQFAKIYRRKLPAVTAMVMIKMYLNNEGRFYVNVPSMFNTLSAFPGGTGDGTKGQHWGLMTPQPGERDDGSWRTGWWRLTDLGRKFVLCDTKVQKFAFIYNNTCLGLSGPLWSIRDALGTRFRYDELMGSSIIINGQRADPSVPARRVRHVYVGSVDSDVPVADVPVPPVRRRHVRCDSDT